MIENFIEVKDVESEEIFTLNISNIKSIYIKRRKILENYIPESVFDLEFWEDDIALEKEKITYSLILETTIANEHRALVLSTSENLREVITKYNHLTKEIGTNYLPLLKFEL